MASGLRSGVIRYVLAGAGWWIISEGEPAAFAVGVPAVIAAVALSRVLMPEITHSVRPLGLLLYIGFFLKLSFIAGLDVARRILHPALPVDPAIVRVRLELAENGPRWLLIDTLSLIPGTLSVSLEGDDLILHCLNRHMDAEAEVRDVERRVARAFA